MHGEEKSNERIEIKKLGKGKEGKENRRAYLSLQEPVSTIHTTNHRYESQRTNHEAL